MTDWYVAPALLTLLDEVNKAYPKRDKASDGGVGNAAHQAESFSDHNPDWNSQPPGCVRAYDIDSNGALGERTALVDAVLAATIGDPRVWYTIWDGRIWSRTYGFVPRVYTGASPHQEHVHVSLVGHEVSEATAHDIAYDTSPWLTGTPGHVLPGVRLHRVLAAARSPRLDVAPVNVRRVQRALKARAPGAGALVVDGRYGPATRAAVTVFQRSLGYRGADADGLLGATSGARLGANRFRLLP